MIEELSLNKNMLKNLDGIEQFGNLKVLRLSSNQIKEWAEFRKVARSLQVLELKGNPVQVTVAMAKRTFPLLRELNGEKCHNDDEVDEELEETH